MPFEKNLRELVIAGMRDWRNGDMDAVMAQYVEDAVFSSPHVSDDAQGAILWLQGHDEIRQHLVRFREAHPVLRVTNIFVGRQFYTLLFDQPYPFTMHVEPNDEGLTRRLAICRSIGGIDLPSDA